VKKTRHQIDGAFVLLLFGIFAVCVLMVLLTGAGSYQRLTERDSASYSRRTAVQYVAAKVRGADAAGCVTVSDFAGDADGGDTLFLKETVDGADYCTRIYYDDGYIRELFTAADAAVSPEDGEKVLAARGLSFSAADGRLTVTATDENGAVTSLTLALRSGGAYPAVKGGGVS